MIFKLARASLMARLMTVTLTILSIALSTALFLGVERVRTGTKASFADTISGTDLIIGARSGSVQLLLYSVFRIGNATNNMSWQSYQHIGDQDEVNWIVPISLGDSHGAFRVMGTTKAFFDHYHFRGGQSLTLAQGQYFDDLFDAVIGADVAKALGYKVGSPLVIAHGIASFSKHDDQPFRVVGVLEKSGTPVDRTVIVSLEGIEAIHVDWQTGGRAPQSTSEDEIRQMDLTPKSITAAMVGVNSKIEIFQLQRKINEFKKEPLLAILPGLALQELWSIVGVAETALIGVSAMVLLVAILGQIVMILSSLNERRREMAIWRSVGASPKTIMGLLMVEAVLMAILGVIIGIVLLYFGIWVARPFVDQAFGIWLPISMLGIAELKISVIIIVFAAIASLLPALRAYKLSLADGIVVKS